MIEISHVLAQRFRAVLRRSVLEQEPRNEWPLLLCRGDAFGLHLHARRGAVGVAYDVPGERPAAALAFRASVLAEFEGRSGEAVTLESLGPGKGRARWYEGRMPCGVAFETVPVEEAITASESPARWTEMPARFLAAVDEAAQTTATEAIRFSMHHVQLRGKTGELIATDGRQLLIQPGFAFPWKDDVLVPRLRAFGLRELATVAPVALGRTGERIFVRAGPWTFTLNVQSGRFPEVRQVVPRPEKARSRLRIGPEDAALLIEALPKLPGNDEDNAPVTLELGDKPIVRARGIDSEATTEVELSRSGWVGPPLRIALNRGYLTRALRLGCLEVAFGQPDQPALFQGEERPYVAVTLHPHAVVPACPGARRLGSATTPVANFSSLQPRSTTMPSPHGNGHAGNGASAPNDSERCPSFVELVSEAEQMRLQAQEIVTRMSRLIAGLKQFRKKGRAVEAAVQSLRDLRLEP